MSYLCNCCLHAFTQTGLGLLCYWGSHDFSQHFHGMSWGVQAVGEACRAVAWSMSILFQACKTLLPVLCLPPGTSGTEPCWYELELQVEKTFCFIKNDPSITSEVGVIWNHCLHVITFPLLMSGCVTPSPSRALAHVETQGRPIV